MHASGPREAGSDPLELLALGHVTILVVFAAWAFGGNTVWAGLALSAWGSLALVLIGWATGRAGPHQRERRRALHWLWPLALLDLYVVVSACNPTHRAVFDGAQMFFVRDPGLPAWRWLPTSARPDVALRALWFFNAAYLAGFNLLLVVRRRRTLRRLFLLLAANALVLAIFGTLQKLVAAPGLFFGLQPVEQSHFFASFIYHNHWGAFTLLMTAAVLGLLAHFSRHEEGRDFWHSPAPAAIVATLFLAATIPLSASRSSTLLVVVLLAVALIGWFRRLRRRRRRSLAGPLILTAFGLAVAGGFVFVLGEEVIRVRLDLTREQLAEMQAKHEYPREVLYRDTWQLARERLWGGWGMGSYPTAFYLYNTQHESSDGPNRLFHDAHSDWLQSIAELGLVGTGLLILCAVLPFLSCRGGAWGTPLAFFLFAGCALVLLYATFEFPFGNRAVVCTWWVAFFGAVQYGRLSARPRPAPSNAA